MNKEDLQKKLDSDNWEEELRKKDYIKDIKRYIFKALDLNLFEKLDILKNERKKINNHKNFNIEESKNIIAEIRIEQLGIYIKKLENKIAIDKMQKDLLNLKSCIKK